MSTLVTMCGELCAAMLNDEHGCGVDISSGLYGEETSIWIKQVAFNHDKLTEQRDTLRNALVRLINHGVALGNADELDDCEDVDAVYANFNDALIKAQAVLEQLK